MKFYVMYINDSESRIKEFESYFEAEAFVKKFNDKHGLYHSGYWIDLIFEGKLHYIDESIKDRSGQ